MSRHGMDQNDEMFLTSPSDRDPPTVSPLRIVKRDTPSPAQLLAIPRSLPRSVRLRKAHPRKTPCHTQTTVHGRIIFNPLAPPIPGPLILTMGRCPPL
ncbi:WW domain-containing protein [Histoplasma ohiense]|nr:WW domain-containing protein [Histoplasma ohiense (nom. inval.)]